MGILAFIALGILCVARLAFTQYKARKLRSTDWDKLIAEIRPISFRALQLVAEDHLAPSGSQLRLEPDEMWALLGGLEGLRRMLHNADRMIALAAYVRRWNFTEAVVVSERIRHDSLLLKRAIFRLYFDSYITRHRCGTPFYLHQAAASYYLMVKRVLALYQTNQYLLYPRLAEVF